jgi:hypothetical protein
MEEVKKYVSLEDILSRDAEELAELKTGEFQTEKLGLIPFTALEQSEFKIIKKDARKQVSDGKGGQTIDVDEDKLAVRSIIAAVDKDKRSSFTFANRELIQKLQQKDSAVTTADDVVSKLLSPGEIYRFANEIEKTSGFSKEAKEETEAAVKN